MNKKPSQTKRTGRVPSQSYRFLFTLMYIGIIGPVVYFNGIKRCGSYFLIGGSSGLVAMLLLMLGLEWFELKRLKESPPSALLMGLLVIRMALFEGVVALDCSGTSILLYPIIPLGAYYGFGGGLSTFLSIFYVGVALWKVWRVDSMWYTSIEMPSVLIAFAFSLLSTQLMARFVRRDDASRRRTEELLVDLETSHLKLRAYLAQLAELAATEERNRLARDIHDSLGHHLTAVNIQLEKALTFQERDPAEAAQAMSDAKQAASAALRDVRRSVGTLRNIDERFSLQEALEDLVKRMDHDRLVIELGFQGDDTGYSRLVLMVLYRAAQEGLTNIQKYAQANHVLLNVEFGEEEARLHLRDDGLGFDPAELDEQESPPQQSFGLQGIKERVELLRGQMALQSNPQQGTEITVLVPKNPAAASDGDWLDLQISKVIQRERR